MISEILQYRRDQEYWGGVPPSVVVSTTLLEALLLLYTQYPNDAAAVIETVAACGAESVPCPPPPCGPAPPRLQGSQVTPPRGTPATVVVEPIPPSEQCIARIDMALPATNGVALHTAMQQLSREERFAQAYADWVLLLPDSPYPALGQFPAGNLDWAPILWGAQSGETDDQFYIEIPVSLLGLDTGSPYTAGDLDCQSPLRPVVGVEHLDAVNAYIMAHDDLREVLISAAAGGLKSLNANGTIKQGGLGMGATGPQNSIVFEHMLYTGNTNAHCSFGCRQLFPQGRSETLEATIARWQYAMYHPAAQLDALWDAREAGNGNPPPLDEPTLTRWMVSHQTGGDPNSPGPVAIAKAKRAINAAAKIRQLVNDRIDADTVTSVPVGADPRVPRSRGGSGGRIVV